VRIRLDRSPRGVLIAARLTKSDTTLKRGHFHPRRWRRTAGVPADFAGRHHTACSVRRGCGEVSGASRRHDFDAGERSDRRQDLAALPAWLAGP
jgi:hypothetical protein